MRFFRFFKYGAWIRPGSCSPHYVRTTLLTHPSNGPEGDGLRRQAIDLLRFPLAAVVVFVHVYTGGFWLDGEQSGFDAYELTRWVGLVRNAFIKGQSVPIYFFMAGYVFFLGGGLDRDRYLGKMRRRVHSLLIPFVVWNALAWILAWYAGVNESLDFSQVWHKGWFPPDVSLWFVGVLMLVAVTTPALWWALRRWGEAVPAVLGLVWLAMGGLGWTLMRQITCGYVFFSLGGWLSIGGRDVVQEFARVRWASTVAYLCLGALLLWHSATERWMWLWHGWEYMKSLRLIAGVPFAFNLALMVARRCPRPAVNVWSKSAFFVYAAHGLVIYSVMRALALVIVPRSGLAALVLMFSTVGVTVLGLVGLYAAMRRLTPGLLRVLSGGRV